MVEDDASLSVHIAEYLPGSDFRISVGLLAFILTLLSAVPAGAFCDRWSGWRSLAGNDDLHNAALFGAGTALVHGLADPPDDARWTSRPGFDRGLRNTFARSSRSDRDDADDLSDALGILTLTAPLLVDAGVKATWMDRDCDLGIDLAAEYLEAMTLTLLVTQSTKVIAGRERPFGRECDDDPRYDSDCDDDERNASFFSGHTSLAATGAGLLCRDSLRRQLWGGGLLARSLPCMLGVGGAIATGIFRMQADQHYFSDVMTGLLVGGAIGLFDVPPVLRLFGDPGGGLGLRARRDVPGAWIVPSVSRSRLGFRLEGRF